MNFSIVIPTYNRAALLKSCLLNLKKINFDRGEFEIIVVDNNSTDQTKQIVDLFKETYPNLQIKYFFEKRQGRSYASNFALSKVKYDHVVFIDDDILVKKNFLDLYRRDYKKYPNAAMIGGKILPLYNAPRSKVKKIIDLVGEESFWSMGIVNLGKYTRTLKYPETLFSGNFSLNLEQLKDDRFAENLGKKYKNIYLYGEDYELCLRLLLKGKTIIYDPELLVSNVIENNRLRLSYIAHRYLIAGIEQATVDAKLKIYKNHQKYSLPLSLKSTLINFLTQLLFNKKKFVQAVNYTAFYFGYYILCPIYLSKSRLRVIFSYL